MVRPVPPNTEVFFEQFETMWEKYILAKAI